MGDCSVTTGSCRRYPSASKPAKPADTRWARTVLSPGQRWVVAALDRLDIVLPAGVLHGSVLHFVPSARVLLVLPSRFPSSPLYALTVVLLRAPPAVFDQPSFDRRFGQPSALHVPCSLYVRIGAVAANGYVATHLAAPHCSAPRRLVAAIHQPAVALLAGAWLGLQPFGRCTRQSCRPAFAFS